jgi:hypothetical protein
MLPYPTRTPWQGTGGWVEVGNLPLFAGVPYRIPLPLILGNLEMTGGGLPLRKSILIA